MTLDPGDPTHYRVRCGETIDGIVQRLSTDFDVHISRSEFLTLNPELAGGEPRSCDIVRIHVTPAVTAATDGPGTVGDDNDPALYEKDPAPGVKINQPPSGGGRKYSKDDPFQGDDNSPDLDPALNPPKSAPLEAPDSMEPLTDDQIPVLLNPDEPCGCV